MATTTPSTTPTVNSSTTPDPIMEAGKRVLMGDDNQGGYTVGLHQLAMSVGESGTGLNAAE